MEIPNANVIIVNYSSSISVCTYDVLDVYTRNSLKRNIKPISTKAQVFEYIFVFVNIWILKHVQFR